VIEIRRKCKVGRRGDVRREEEIIEEEIIEEERRREEKRTEGRGQRKEKR
jgi:hypothetical protein